MSVDVRTSIRCRWSCAGGVVSTHFEICSICAMDDVKQVSVGKKHIFSPSLYLFTVI